MGDIRTDCCHDPCYLVTQHRWRGHDIVSGEKQISVTQARRLHIDENFATYRRGDLHVLEIKSMAECVQDKCFHIWLQICDNLDRYVQGFVVISSISERYQMELRHLRYFVS